MLRGMIDEHRQKLDREKVVKQFWTTGRVIVATTGAFVYFALQLIIAVLAIKHGR